MAFCPQCKTVARDDNEKCRACGATLPVRPKFDPSKDGWPWERKNDSNAAKRYDDDPEYDMVYPEPKSIVIVIFLNLFLTGSGHFYLGQTGKGLTILAIATLGSIIMPFGLLAVFVLIAAAIRIAAIVDGVLIANKMNQDKMVGKWEWF